MKAHFIPEFHLAQFIGYSWRRLAMYDKRSGAFLLKPVKTAARIQDYYLLPGQTAQDRLRLESEFSVLESLVAPVIKQLAEIPAGGRVNLTEPARQAVAGYVAILHARVPAFRDPAFARAQAMSKDLRVLGLDDPAEFLALARARGWSGTDDQIERRRARFVDDLESGRQMVAVNRAISLMGLTTAAEKVRPLILDRRWVLLRTDHWPGLVLGDQPVTLLANARILPSIGFGTPGVSVMMPLSPSMLLLITDAPRETLLQVTEEPRRLGLRESWWSQANKVAWLSSQRYVYAQKLGHLHASAALLAESDRRRNIRAD